MLCETLINIITIDIQRFELSSPANNYLLKVNNRSSKKRYETCSKVIIKTPGQCQLHRSKLMCSKLSALGVHFSKVSIIEKVFKKWDYNEEKLISEAEYGSRNIPVTTNLISLLISKFFDCQLKQLLFQKKQKNKSKFLFDVSMSTAEPVS